MSVLDTSNIKNVIYNNIEADALYKGSNLIWKKEEKVVPSEYTELIIDTRLYDDTSTNSKWGKYDSNGNLQEVDFVTPGIYTVKLDENSTIINNSANAYGYSKCVIECNKIIDFETTKNENFLMYYFKNCTNLTKFNCEIPNGYTNISHMFYGCTSFNQPITLPESVSLCTQTFYECKSFNQPITIHEGITYCSHMFYGCTSFNQPIELPSSMIYCGYMFANCKALTSVVSNWNKTYKKSITPTNCYITCTAINTIDGQPGTLDDIPTTWGGNKK